MRVILNNNITAIFKDFQIHKTVKELPILIQYKLELTKTKPAQVSLVLAPLCVYCNKIAHMYVPLQF